MSLVTLFETDETDNTPFDYAVVSSDITPRLQTLANRWWGNQNEFCYQQGKLSRRHKNCSRIITAEHSINGLSEH